VPPREFILIADESTQKGPLYSNFFGGLLISSDRVEPVSSALAEEKLRLNLRNEVKWNKTSLNYLGKYCHLMSLFFKYVRSGDVKVRITFTPNSRLPLDLSRYHRDHKFNLLYYQFIRHAFDFQYCDLGTAQISLQIFLDTLSGSMQKKHEFAQFLYGLNTVKELSFPGGRFLIPDDGIGEINSRESDLLQCLDVVLGAMQFRLNQGHLVVQKETGRRANRTIAKDALSNHLLNLVRDFIPEFRLDVTTRAHPATLRWRHPYRHWSFEPDCQ